MSFKKVVLMTAVIAGMTGMSLNANADASQEVTLHGIITNTTCDVTVNGGQSVLNVGVFKSSEFTPNTKLGSVPMSVTLTNCSADEDGDLIIQGLTPTANIEQNLFVDNASDTVGFMIADANDATLKNGEGVPVSVTAADGGEYTFNVGMATMDTTPAAGKYSAPILVAYFVN